MQAKDLKPLSQLAQRFGVKAIIYGKPGTGKTPMLQTAPRPLVLLTEPGSLSVRKVTTVPAWEAYTQERIEEFFEWFTKSAEAKNFDTLAIDSGSEAAEIVISKELNKQKDGRKAYGEMSKTVMRWFDSLYFMPQKHIVLICKQFAMEVGKTVTQQNGAFVVEMQYQAAPYFPGNALNVSVPHRYDEILHVAEVNIPGVGPKMALRTRGTPEILARDRSGNLNEVEPTDLTALFAKAMQ